MKCAKCGEKIEYNDYVKIDGKYYHTKCKIVPGLDYTEFEKALEDVLPPKCNMTISAINKENKIRNDTEVETDLDEIKPEKMKAKFVTTAIAKTIKDAKIDFSKFQIGMAEATMITKKPKNTIKKRKSRKRKKIPTENQQYCEHAAKNLYNPGKNPQPRKPMKHKKSKRN